MKNKNVLVLGMAKSGFEAAKVLHRLGANVLLNDGKDLSDSAEAKTLISLGISVFTGSHPFHLLDGIDFIVKNPGIPYSIPFVEEALRRNIPILTEIELAYFISPAEFIGITGSNGKTTTTMLTHELLKYSEKTPLLAGNIGEVACRVVQQANENHLIVTELSSFQLMGIETFRPKISILLNLSAAHLDYHGSFENYAAAKFNLFKNQKEDDFLIYNEDDPVIKEAVKNAACKRIPFSQKQVLENGIYLKNDAIYYKKEYLFSLKDIALPGKHNLENIMAACVCAILYGVNRENILRVIRNFSGVKHRLQYVTKVENRVFYNNSKSTNSVSTRKAIEAFENQVIWIAGGLNRGDDFSEVVPALKNVKAAFFYGETAQILKNVALRENIPLVHVFSNLKEATEAAFCHSIENDIILLSPACASWDQYKTYEVRGDEFIQIIQQLKTEKSSV